MSVVFLGLGANVGDRRGNMLRALELLKEQCSVLAVSSFIETKPVGYADQPDFLNGAAKIETSLSPDELLAFVLSIEKRLGRTRERKNGPRTIDIDILLYDDLVQDRSPEIPHPRMHERSFVLVPLKEIAPDALHPVLEKKVREL